MPLKTTIELEQGAWARCIFRPARRNHEFTIAHDSDGVTQLIIAAIALITGYQKLSFTFHGTQDQWLFTAENIPDSERVDFEIADFALSLSDQNYQAQSVVKFSCLPIDFGKSILDAVTTVLDKSGVKVYNKIWSDYPFPMELFHFLEKLVNDIAHDA